MTKQDKPKRSPGRPHGSGAGLTKRVEFRLSPEQKVQFMALGAGEWVRKMLDACKTE